MSSLFVALLAGLALVGAAQAADIDDVTGKQLEAVMETEDFLAVYWYTKNCKTCERVLTVLERLSNEIAEAGVTVVKVNDKKAAKAQAIRNFPALTFFKGGDAKQYEGDLMNSDSLLDFLASPGSTDLPDQIEDVTASQLEALVHDKTYVAVFFYDKGDKTSIKALAALETIDDDLDVHKIAMLKMSDTAEAKNYGVKEFPSIIMFKNKIPELYPGDTTNEAEVLAWIFKLAEVSSSSGGVFGLGAASAAEIEAPAPHVFKPKQEKPSPKAKKPPAQVEKPPPQAVDKPPIAEKPSAKVDKAPPLVKETPKPVKLKKGETSESIKESKPKKDPEPKPKEPEAVKVEEPENIAEEVVSEETMTQIDTSTPGDDTTDETDSDNISDAIKNGNNVVAFFSHNAGYERRQNATSKNNEGFFSWVGRIGGAVDIVDTLDGVDQVDWCILLPCATAKPSHKKSLNIDKLQSVPLYKPEGKKKQTSGGWLVWIFGSTDHHDDTEIDETEVEDDTVEEDDQTEDEEEEEAEEDGDESTIIVEEEVETDDADRAWYEVTLLPTKEGESWYEVDLFGDEDDAEEGEDDKRFCQLCNAVISAFSINWLGDSDGNTRPWYQVSLFSQPGDDTAQDDDDEDDGFGEDTTKKAFCKMCNQVISVFSVNWLGDSDENERSWYEVDLLSTQDSDGPSWYEVDLLGDDGLAPNWYHVNLFGSLVSADGDNQSEVDDADEDEEDDIIDNIDGINGIGIDEDEENAEEAEEDTTDEKNEVDDAEKITDEDIEEVNTLGTIVDEEISTEDQVDVQVGDDEKEMEMEEDQSEPDGNDLEEEEIVSDGSEEATEEEIVDEVSEGNEEPDKVVEEETEEIVELEPEEVVEVEPEEVIKEEPEEDNEEDFGKTDEEKTKEVLEENDEEELVDNDILTSIDDDEETIEEEAKDITDDTSNGEIEVEEPTTEKAEDTKKVETIVEEEEENETFGEWLFGSDDEEPEVIQEEIVISKKREINKADLEEILNDKPEVLEELTQFLLNKLLDSKRGEILKSEDVEDEDTDDVAEDNYEQDDLVDVDTAIEESIEDNYEQDDLVDVDTATEESNEEDADEIKEPLEEDPYPEQGASSNNEDVVSSEEISGTAELIKTSKSSLVIFFYESLDKISKKIISGIVKVEGHFSGKDIKFLTVDANDMPEISLPTVPSLVYFKNGQPTVYEENLMNEDAIKDWVELELQSNQDVIEDLSTEQVHGLMEKEEYVMVYIYAPECEACDEAIKQLEEIDDDADAVGVKFVKTEDADFAEEYGISEFPAIIYFEHEQPSIYDGDPGEETELLTWLLYQMKEDTIENINRELMTNMIEDYEFLAVFFYTGGDPTSAKVLRHLELIDDEASQYGVRLVKIDDALMSKKYGHREPPGLGYFRKGNYIKYDGDLLDDEEMLDWLTDPNTMEISDQIEKVNKKMFEKLISRNEFLAVMFYSESDCKQCDSVLEELENIDDDAEAAGIPIVKLEDKTLAKNIGVFALPAIVFFRNFGQEPTIYAGDLKREDSILEWLLIQKDPSNEAIEDMDGEALRKAIDKSDAVAVFVYTQEGCETCLPILQALENIDDDTDRQKISMVKTIDAAFAEEVGIEKFPGLVFFKDGVPNLYEGDLMLEEEVLDWLIEMKVESHIELITRPMLESMVEEIQYLAVFFYKLNCRTCDQVIVELENIDDDCDMYGIQMVKLKDPQLAKRYGIKTFPALVYFRNGNPLTYDGDLKNEESVLEWLIDDDNRELEDEIEAVNYRMLDKLLETSPFMAVFFYDDECIECEAILEQLENIDDEADIYGIDFVKNNDPHAAKQYNIYNTPALVYFRKMTPIVYDGDLMDDERILEWLTSQDVFEIKDEIEEVNRKMLEKLLDENEFVAVYFYEDDCAECNEVLEGLERIDDETDALDITFVKINDPRYAKKYGVNKLPALVYFRRKFPSIYRDSLLGEAQVLDWLTTNRYKQMELGVFMYAIIALAVTFMFYTAFLMFGLKPREPEKKKEE